MRLVPKRIWLRIVLGFLIVAASVWGWHRTHQEPPQIILLPNGDEYRFVGTTYGTRDVPPSFSERLVDDLPMEAANAIRRTFGGSVRWYGPVQTFDTPQLFVWFEPWKVKTSGKVMLLSAILADEQGREGGTQSITTFGGGTGWLRSS